MCTLLPSVMQESEKATCGPCLLEMRIDANDSGTVHTKMGRVGGRDGQQSLTRVYWVCFLFLKKVKGLDVRELAQAFTELAALLEDLNSVLSTDVAAYNPP